MSTQDDAQLKAVRISQQTFSTWALAFIGALLSVIWYLYHTIESDRLEQAKSRAELQGDLKAISTTLTEMQKQLRDTYRVDDARRDREETLRRFDTVERRVGTIEAILAPKTQPQALQQWRKN